MIQKQLKKGGENVAQPDLTTRTHLAYKLSESGYFDQCKGEPFFFQPNPSMN